MFVRLDLIECCWGLLFSVEFGLVLFSDGFEDDELLEDDVNLLI